MTGDEHGWVRTPSGRVRPMTDREIDRHADKMDAFAERYVAALDGLQFYRHATALVEADA